MYSVNLKNIYKSFGTNSVLKDVSFDLKKATIHALLGENGAGKSTLMNILGGVIEKDSGNIVINGDLVNKINPRIATELKITFVHQELNLINDLNIYQNIYLGQEKIDNCLLNDKYMHQETKKTLDLLNIDLDPNTLVDSLSNLEKQLIEIAKAIHYKSSILILDEPTSSLTNKEIPQLFKILNDLKDKGVSIIYISHKLPEIFEICDEYTVLRDGIVVGSGLIKDVNEDELINLMSGKMAKQSFEFDNRVLNEVVFEIDDLCLKKVFDNISFKLYKGEVLGLTGLQGDGRLELLQTIYGYYQNSSGKIIIDDKVINKSAINKSLKAKIGFVPSNRKENAIIQDLSILENFYITDITHKYSHGLINFNFFKKAYVKLKEMLNIKAINENHLITSLSGGNQQKVILARWLKTDAKVLILDNPTQGIDIMAKTEIYQLIRELANKGYSIIISSAEVPELKKCCDRVLVFYDKKIVDEISNDDIDENRIMAYATGSLKG